MTEDQLSNIIVGYAIEEVHRELRLGILETAYRDCLFYELASAGFKVEKEKELPIVYKDLV